MDNLFSESPDFQRTQYRKLSDNIKEWQQEIGSVVEEKLPKDLGLSVVVTFQKVDNEKGYAQGSAVATEPSSGDSIGIPIIVKSWHLAPIDLFFKEGKVYPLNDDNLAKVFYQNSMGAGLASAKAPPNMADDAFSDSRNPPLGGKYSYSSPISMIDQISGTLGAEDISILKMAVAKDNRLLVGFHKNGTLDVLSKYAEDKPKPTQQDKINKEKTLSVFTIKKDGPDKYRLYSAPDEVYDPVVISTNRQGIKSFLGMKESSLCESEVDPFYELDRYGHFTLTPPDPVYGKPVEGVKGSGAGGSGDYGADLGDHKNPWVFNPLQDDRTVVSADKFGRYGVKDADGVMAKGWVVPNVVGFDGGTKPIKLFLGKALASMQDRIFGIHMSDDDDAGLKPDRPDTGKIGTLVYRDGEKVFATVPFQVTRVTVYKNLRSIAIVDYQGKKCNLILSPNVNGIVPVKDGDNPELGPLLGSGSNYIVSAKMFFVRMPRLCDVSSGPDDFKRKAAEWLDKNPIKIASANGRYIFKGGQVNKLANIDRVGKPAMGEKVAFDFNHLPRPEAEFLLGYWGLGREKTAEVLDSVKDHIYLEVHHLNFPPTELAEKTASPGRLALIQEMRADIPSLIKWASSFDTADTVDSVLSLGFINDENVEQFASAKPALWETSHTLAKLLLASRMGMEDIPEEHVRAALMHLQKVIKGLGRLEMLKIEKEKTASVRKEFRAPVGGRLMTTMTPIGFTR